MADLDGLLFTKKGKSLVPSDIKSDEWLADLGEGKEVLMSGRRPRNPKFHRLAFAMLRIVVDNTEDDFGMPRWSSEDDLLTDLKRATGLFERRVNLINGEETLVLGSISFAAMDEVAFKRWFNRAVYVLANVVLGVKEQSLIDEVFAMAGDGEKPWRYDRKATRGHP